jgi:hypothetical protein
MGGKGIMRRSGLGLGLIFALGAVEGRAQQTGAAGTLTYAALFLRARDRAPGAYLKRLREGR